MSRTNSERDQNRVADLVETFDRYGYVMFPQQRRIYEQIAAKLDSRISVLEAGCGNGVGSAILERSHCKLVATDKLQMNAQFAECLYPWIDFGVWDIQQPWRGDVDKADVVVCIEALEHVADPAAAIHNLIGAAKCEVWISTPNGAGKPKPPSNPYHCQELTVQEMLDMISLEAPGCQIAVLDWETFEPVGMDTLVDPLVYRICPGSGPRNELSR